MSKITVAVYDNGASESYHDLGTTYQTSQKTRQTEHEALRGLRLAQETVELHNGTILTGLQYDVLQLEIQFMREKPRFANDMTMKCHWIRKHKTMRSYNLGMQQVKGILLEVSERIAMSERWLDE